MKRLFARWFVRRKDFDQLYQALVTARALIVRHHEVGRAPLAWGGFCSICHQADGSEKEMDQICAALALCDH